MRHEKYTADHPLRLSCSGYLHEGSCCSSCIDDYYDGLDDVFPLVHHPLNENITAYVCCNADESLDGWEEAIKIHEEESTPGTSKKETPTNEENHRV